MVLESIAQAKSHFSEMIDLSLSGEQVVITRHGRPVVELRPVGPVARALAAGDLDWLAGRRVGAMTSVDAGALLRDMRDEAG